MRQTGDRLQFVDVHYSAKLGTMPGALKKLRLLFGRTVSTFTASGEVQLDMTYIKCPSAREHVARLSTPLVLLKGVSGLSDQMDVFTALMRLYDVTPFLENIGVWNANATSNVKCKQRVFPFWWIHVPLISLQLPRLILLCYLRWFRSDGSAMSAVAN